MVAAKGVMDYVKLATKSDFRDTRIKSFRVLGKLVAIVKDADGTFWATEIACKHQNADLTTGRFRGDTVTCPRHGWTYDIRSGECLTHSSARLRRHGLKVIGEELHVSVHAIEPEAEMTDEDAMPEIVIRPQDDAP